MDFPACVFQTTQLQLQTGEQQGQGDSDEITWEENARSNHGERLTD